MSARKQTLSDIVTQIIRDDFHLATEDVMKKAREMGCVNADSTLRQIIYSQRSVVRRERADAAVSQKGSAPQIGAKPAPAAKTDIKPTVVAPIAAATTESTTMAKDKIETPPAIIPGNGPPTEKKPEKPAVNKSEGLTTKSVLKNAVALAELIDMLGGTAKLREVATLLTEIGPDLDAYIATISELSGEEAPADSRAA